MNVCYCSLILLLLVWIGETKIQERRDRKHALKIRLAGANSAPIKLHVPKKLRRKHIIKCCGFKKCMPKFNATSKKRTKNLDQADGPISSTLIQLASKTGAVKGSTAASDVSNNDEPPTVPEVGTEADAGAETSRRPEGTEARDVISSEIATTDVRTGAGGAATTSAFDTILTAIISSASTPATPLQTTIFKEAISTSNKVTESTPKQLATTLKGSVTILTNSELMTTTTAKSTSSTTVK